jgi:Fe-S cluster biosynthesis and repair protein YggX
MVWEKKVSETLSQKTSWTWWYMHVIPATQETHLKVADKSARPYLKNKLKGKRLGDGSSACLVNRRP